MNKKNKIVLSLIFGIAMNQAFASEGKENKKPVEPIIMQNAAEGKEAVKDAISTEKEHATKAAKEQASSYKETLLKYKDAVSYYAAGIFLGAFAIEHFKLTANKAFIVKYGSLALTVAASGWVIAKGYTYFFEEEVDEEDVF
ncbi:hypothetical protein EKK58_03795 [Candidatus Dependentiae bacterium]|nr:MAG: hypothetical protein EKK58_03795 [Candidatus Dependentiae bacterium]